jgi:hypothetical protein
MMGADMTHTLTKKQLNALRVTLSRYGLDVKPLAKPRAKSSLSALRAWKPVTPAGARCKSRMLMFAKLPPIVGVTDYKVRGLDGQWYSEADGALFDAAKQYQAGFARTTKPADFNLYPNWQEPNA